MPRLRFIWTTLCLCAAVGLSSSCGTEADAPPGSTVTGGSAGSSGSGAAGAGGAAATDSGMGGNGGGIDLDGGIGNICPRCSEDLHSIIGCDDKVVKICTGDQGCDKTTVTCIDACSAADNAKRSIGCEYYAVFMDQLEAQSCFAVFVANTWNTLANIQVEYDGQQLPLSGFGYLPVGAGPNLNYFPMGSSGLAPGKVGILFLSGPDGTPSKDNPVCPKPAAVPSGVMLHNKTGKGKAFKITSDVPVVAYQMNPYGGGSAAVTGASLLIPSSAWGNEYLAVHAYDSGPQFTSMNIVAKEPTAVTMIPPKNIVGGAGLPPGSAKGTYTFNLAAGEHAQFTQLAELTGAVISADKPVGFFAGARCSQVPNSVYACDHLEQMIPPARALGNEYVGVSHTPRSAEPSMWRLMGVVDNTKLTWSSDVGGPTVLQMGEVVEFVTQFPFVVKSQGKTHPFLLMAHMTGGSTANMQGVGDADAVLSVPPEQFLREYVFFTDPTYPVTNLVVVRSKQDGVFLDVNLDCAGPLTGWKKLGDYEYTRVFLTQNDFESVGNCTTGAHRMASASKFGLWVWGWGKPGTSTFSEYVSYGYPGGMNVQPINEIILPK